MKRLYIISVLVITGLLVISSTSSQEDNAKLNFAFASLSDAGTDDNGVHHQVLMSGFGEFDSEVITGGGFYNHWDAASGSPAAGEPLNLLSSGKWQAERVISWTQTDNANNPYGGLISGILEMEVRLFPDDGPEDGMLATLTVNCNAPAAGVFTGLGEGFYIELDGISFEAATFPETTFFVGATAFFHASSE
jgi:hypothetical protein